MMKKLLILVIIVGVVQWWYTDPTIHASSADVSFSYIVKYSGDGGKNDQLPMLVALHGNGDTVDNFYATALDQFNIPLRIVLLKGPMSKGRGNAWPWNAQDFKQYGSALNEVVNLLVQKYQTVHKPVLMGFSGGAMMAYFQAVKHGKSYSYIYPISGQMTDDLLGDDLIESGAPVYAFHGKNDNVISFNSGEQAVNLLQSKHVKVVFTGFEGGHHGVFTDMKSKITRHIEKKIGGFL